MVSLSNPSFAPVHHRDHKRAISENIGLIQPLLYFNKAGPAPALTSQSALKIGAGEKWHDISSDNAIAQATTRISARRAISPNHSSYVSDFIFSTRIGRPAFLQKAGTILAPLIRSSLTALIIS